MRFNPFEAHATHTPPTTKFVLMARGMRARFGLAAKCTCKFWSHSSKFCQSQINGWSSKYKDTRWWLGTTRWHDTIPARKDPSASRRRLAADVHERPLTRRCVRVVGIGGNTKRVGGSAGLENKATHGQKRHIVLVVPVPPRLAPRRRHCWSV